MSAVAPTVVAARPAPVRTATPPPVAAVLQVHQINVQRALQILRNLYPNAHLSVDSHANAIVVVAPQDEVEAMRTIVSGIDVKNPSEPTNDVVQLHSKSASQIVAQIAGLYPNAHVGIASKTSLLIRATPEDMTQIKALISSLDVSTVTPTPAPLPVGSLHVLVANPKVVARAVERSYPHVRAAVSGASIIISGPGDELESAKTLAQSLDSPGIGVKYTEIYRIHNVDAQSVGDLIQRSFPSVKVTVDAQLNALSVLATAAEHAKIAAGIAQLDASQSAGGATGASGGGPAYGDGNIDVVQLESAMPGLNGSPSTSATDIATAVQQALSSMASDLHISVPANTNEIILTGSPPSIRLAKELIARLDQPLPLVVLDTEVVEMDENVARNLGISLPGAVISSVFSEIAPTPNPITGQQGRLIGLQSLTRTGIQFTAELNMLVQNGNARVLADPRITTISGRTASIHAGDQLAILTQTAGSIGTPVTQQLQTFNTGVSLDITPMVGPSGSITVALHPVVNSLTGILNGVPQIAQRDTQTVVQLQNNQTLVIGGLIQEQRSQSTQKVPILGEIPIIGKLFDSSNLNFSRNELVIVVTPHIVKPGEPLPAPNAALNVPTPVPYRTLPPNTSFPTGQQNVPQPTAMPYTPAPETPEPRRTPIPVNVGPVLNTPVAAKTPSQQPTPVAFASANVFQFGTPPQNAYGGPSDAPQIFYATLSPTVVKNGTLVTVSAITSTNVAKVTIGYGSVTTSLSRLSPSNWQASYNFNAGSAGGQNTILLSLIAYRADGTAAQIQIPVSLLNTNQ